MTREYAMKVIARYIVGYLMPERSTAEIRAIYARISDAEWLVIVAETEAIQSVPGSGLDAELAVLVETMAGAFDPQLRQDELNDAYCLLSGCHLCHPHQ